MNRHDPNQLRDRAPAAVAVLLTILLLHNSADFIRPFTTHHGGSMILPVRQSPSNPHKNPLEISPEFLDHPIMCGRYSLSKKEMRLVSKLPPGELRMFFKERYNIAPTQTVPVILLSEGQLTEKPMRWGLQPSWSTGPIINAKCETLVKKPAFRRSFRERRCLIPADGFYEWRKPDKTPFRFVLPDREPFCFAGIWDWSSIGDANTPTETFTILTTEANPDVQPYHHRMPLVLAPAQCDDWLGDSSAAERLLLQPCAVRFDVYPVNPIVNRAGNDDPRCVEAVQTLL